MMRSKCVLTSEITNPHTGETEYMEVTFNVDMEATDGPTVSSSGKLLDWPNAGEEGVLSTKSTLRALAGVRVFEAFMVFVNVLGTWRNNSAQLQKRGLIGENGKPDEAKIRELLLQPEYAEAWQNILDGASGETYAALARDVVNKIL